MKTPIEISCYAGISFNNPIYLQNNLKEELRTGMMNPPEDHLVGYLFAISLVMHKTEEENHI